MRMGNRFRSEVRRARHEIFGWKNLLFGWSAWSGLGVNLRDTTGDVRKLLADVGNGGPAGGNESFDQAMSRQRISAGKLGHIESQLRLRASWWLLASVLAFVSLLFAPLSQRPIVHGMVASALVFLCLSRATAWYFRSCQVHDRDLYDFQTWFHTNKLVRRVIAVLVSALILAALFAAGVAHAGPLGLHDFSPDANDPSVSALRSVFGGIVDTVLGGGDPKSDGTTSSLGAMMVPFNSAILMVTMIFAGYATFRTVIDTAHSGDFMGRQKDVSGYVIGRILLGVGLLVPLGSGYSLIQYGMMWWSLQGAGLGNAVNSAALDYMGTNKQSMIAQPEVPSAESFVRSALKAHVCMAAMNKQYTADGDKTRIVMNSSTYQLTPAQQGWWDRIKGQISYNSADAAEHPLLNLLPWRGMENAADYNTRREQWVQDHTYNAYRFSFDAQNSSYTNPEGICGSFSFSNPTENDMDESAITRPIVDAQAQAVSAIMASPQLDTIAQQIVNADGSVPSDQLRMTIHSEIQSLADSYSDAVVQAVAAQGGISGMSDSDWTQFISTMKQTGWAYLPSYYNQMIRANDNVQSALNAVPEFNYSRVTAFASGAELTTYNDAMTRLDEFLQTPGDLIMANAQKVGGVNLSQSVWEDIKEQCISKTQGDAEKAKDAAVANSSSADGIYGHVQKCLSVIPRRGIFQLTSSLMGGNMNHIVHIKSIGDTIIGMGDGLIMANFFANLVTGNVVGSMTGISSAMQSMGGLLSTIALALLTFGGIAAYYIPLIPYIYGTIAFVKWLTLVIESIIAGPVFAAAHAFPEGHEVSGSAGPGYRLLLGLILRPALTVIGFYLAIVLAQPVSDFINVTYGNAVMGASSGSMVGLTSLVAYVAIYVSMMTTVMHSVFSLINWVPDNVLRWIGAGLQAHGIGDNESHEMKGAVLAAFGRGSTIATENHGRRPAPRPPGPGAGGPGPGGGGDQGDPGSSPAIDFNNSEVR